MARPGLRHQPRQSRMIGGVHRLQPRRRLSQADAPVVQGHAVARPAGDDPEAGGGLGRDLVERHPLDQGRVKLARITVQVDVGPRDPPGDHRRAVVRPGRDQSVDEHVLGAAQAGLGQAGAGVQVLGPQGARVGGGEDDRPRRASGRRQVEGPQIERLGSARRGRRSGGDVIRRRHLTALEHDRLRRNREAGPVEGLNQALAPAEGAFSPIPPQPVRRGQR